MQKLPKTLVNNFCLMPWVHLYIDTTGKAKACCNTSITYGSVRNKSIEEIWEGEKINTFRNNLLKGIKDKRCAICYNKESAGKSSIRTETLEKYKKHLPKALQNLPKSKPVYLDVRFSNICNLKCRTCWHGASSSWFEDAKILKTNVGNKAILKATTNNPRLIQNILSYSSDIEEIYFAGGEPLLMEEHYLLLEQLIQKNKTDTLIRYNTNLSQLNLKDKNVIDFWKKFKHIHLSISIDAIGKKVELIRSGLKWDKLIQNILTIKEQCPNIKLEIAPTVSVFNVLDLADLHQYFYKNQWIDNINSIYINILERPSYYNIQVLPTPIKQKVKHKIQQHILWLQQNKATKSTIEEFNSIIKYMQLSDDTKGYSQYKKEVARINKLRNELLDTL